MGDVAAKGWRAQVARTSPSSCNSGFSVVILAAGSNSHDQRLTYRRRTLVAHAAYVALASGASDVVVVGGEQASQIAKALRHLRVRVVRNADWREGLSSSIRAGIKAVAATSGVAVIWPCDQASVTPEHLRTLADKALSSDSLDAVASAYDGIVGAPCAFARPMFGRLLQLRGPHGARDLVRSATTKIEAVSFAATNTEVVPCSPVRPCVRRSVDAAALADRGRADGVRGPPTCALTVFAV